MKILFSILMFFTLQANLFAGGPVTHYYFAEKWKSMVKDYHWSDCTKFHLGNFFSSITMIGIATNLQIPKQGVTLNDIYSDPFPFVAGVQLHNFIEERRQAFILTWSVYDSIRDVADGHAGTLLKLIEDEILFDNINPKHPMGHLNETLEEELLLAGTIENVKLWHLNLRNYFGMRPSNLLKYLVSNNQGFVNIPPETVRKWSEALPGLAHDPTLLNYTMQFVNETTKLFEIFKAEQ